MTRRIFLALGLLVLAGLWLGPLPQLAGGSFATHMGMHMGLVAVAAPLLVLGLAGGPGDPVRRAPRWFPPIPLSLFELLVVWVWHAPVLHHWARHNPVGLVAEQGMFLFAGLLVWISVLGGGEERKRERAGAGVAALLLTSMHMTLLGALLALTPRALFSHAGRGPLSPLTPLEDQHLGGAIMIAVGGASYLAGGLWLTLRLVRERNEQEAPA